MPARLATAVLALLLLSPAHQRPDAAVARIAAAKPPAAKHRPKRHAVKPKSTPFPNDPWWGSEWGLARIGMPALWRAMATPSAPGAVIAVVDTGVDPARRDLAGAVPASYGGTDAVGHGTAVAEVAAGRGNDSIGAAGVCWSCRIMPVDVAAAGTATAAGLAAGIRSAVDQGANIVNLSMVLSGADADVAAAVAYAEARGVLVVAAAGNDGGTAPTYPAAYPGVISVVAVDPSDRLYPWSTHGSWATFAAPGCAAVADGAGARSDFCGSSAATPVVSGLAGLLWSSGLASADAVRAALAAATVPVDGGIAAGGRVDAALLVARLPR